MSKPKTREHQTTYSKINCLFQGHEHDTVLHNFDSVFWYKTTWNKTQYTRQHTTIGTTLRWGS